MQCVYNGIMPGFLLGVARWKEYEDVAIGGIPFQVPFQSAAVHSNVFDCDGFRIRHCRGYLGGYLRCKRGTENDAHQRHQHFCNVGFHFVIRFEGTHPRLLATREATLVPRT